MNSHVFATVGLVVTLLFAPVAFGFSGTAAATADAQLRSEPVDSVPSPLSLVESNHRDGQDDNSSENADRDDADDTDDTDDTDDDGAGRDDGQSGLSDFA
jgi:hypothetical protein